MNNELQHHGILGMKWGIRRFQNEDGSLTELGEKRYGVGSDAYSRRHEVSEAYSRYNSGRHPAETEQLKRDADRFGLRALGMTVDEGNAYSSINGIVQTILAASAGHSYDDAQEDARYDEYVSLGKKSILHHLNTLRYQPLSNLGRYLSGSAVRFIESNLDDDN